MSAVTSTPGRSVTPVVTANSGNVTKKPRKPKPSPFQRLRTRVCLSVEACAELCGVTPRTVQNWDAKGAPLLAMRFLEMYDRHDCSGHGPDWRGFRFSRGKLVCGRLSFTPRHLKAVPHYVDVFNRLEGAKLRLQDGLPLDQAFRIVFGSPAFLANLGTVGGDQAVHSATQ